MPKHQLTREQTIDGLEKALASRRTPRWLKPRMREYLEHLRGGGALRRRRRKRRR